MWPAALNEFDYETKLIKLGSATENSFRVPKLITKLLQLKESYLFSIGSERSADPEVPKLGSVTTAQGIRGFIPVSQSKVPVGHSVSQNS